MRANQLYLKLSKCSFHEPSVVYLGHVVSGKGDTMDVSKVQAIITDWPRPRSVRVLHGFMGLVRYYRRFIKEFGMIMAPLANLLKRDALQWSDEAKAAFITLKQALTTTPALALPNFTKTFIVECEASDFAISPVFTRQTAPSPSLVALPPWRPHGL
jgi:hypothetical protein